jgi:DNA processing protein
MTTTATNLVCSDAARGYLRLQRVPDVGPIRARSLVRHFGHVEAVFSASIRELEHVEGIGTKTAESIFRCRDNGFVEKEIARAAEFGVRILCHEDEEYPRSLLHIPDPPICLYVRGTIAPTDAVAIAVVGTRRCSHYAQEQAVRFGELLAGAGFTVISGLARGVDGDAHRGALRGGGRTIAVLGNGLHTVYPSEHGELGEEIVQRGALVTELEVDVTPDAKNFPPRNRIIAGLSLGTLVIEAGKQSGALITARLATEYNREVFALPGAIDRPANNAGSNALIRDGGAKLVTCLEDILDELGAVGTALQPATETIESAAAKLPRMNEVEQSIWNVIARGVEDLEGICGQAALEAARVTSTLTALQLRGLIRQLPGNRFALRSKH